MIIVSLLLILYTPKNKKRWRWYLILGWGDCPTSMQHKIVGVKKIVVNIQKGVSRRVEVGFLTFFGTSVE
jgi:hypothetical protein